MFHGNWRSERGLHSIRWGISFKPSRYDLWAPSLAAILVLWICLTAWLKLYADHWKSNFSSIVRRSSEAAILLGSITVIVTFFSQGNGIAISRTFVFILLPSACCCSRWPEPPPKLGVFNWIESGRIANESRSSENNKLR